MTTPPTQGEHAQAGKQIVHDICRAVAELPDRNSPEDWPEAMLVTHEELADIVRAALTASPVAQAETENLRKALQFYADKEHFAITEEGAWDTVSGEPQNYWCDEAGTAMVEDGSIARLALAGQPIKFEDEDAETEPAPAVVSTNGAESNMTGGAYVELLHDLEVIASTTLHATIEGSPRSRERDAVRKAIEVIRASHGQAPAEAAQKYDDTLLPFLALMRRELHANSGKGDRPGWLKMSADTALLEIYWHTAKLSAAVKNNDGPAIIEHSADVANMAMMLLDVCGGIPTAQAAPAGATVPVAVVTRFHDLGGEIDWTGRTILPVGAHLYAQAAPTAQAAPAGAASEVVLEEALRERDAAEDFIDTLLDEVLGADRAEWSSAYGRAEALEEVRERITALHRPDVDRAWTQFQAATAQAAPAAGAVAETEDVQRARLIAAIAQRWIGDRTHLGALIYLDDLAWALKTLAAAAPTPAAQADSFQQRVQPWLLKCFGAEIAADRVERNHRFLEEALELVQSLGCTASEAHQLVDYVFGRPVGEPVQEAGGVMVTLAALCLASGLDMHRAGETELARISAPELVAKIRAKQAAKPKHSPLPEAVQEDAARGKGLSSLSVWWAMHESQWELCGDVVPDDAVVLVFMGSGASTQVTAGDLRAALAAKGGKND